MNDFIQMDIFFFISSITAIIFLLLIAVVGVYVFLIVKKVNQITKEFRDLSLHISQKTSEATESISEKIDALLSHTGPVEKMVAAVIGTILARIFSFRGKMKRGARKGKKANEKN